MIKSIYYSLVLLGILQCFNRTDTEWKLNMELLVSDNLHYISATL